MHFHCSRAIHSYVEPKAIWDLQWLHGTSWRMVGRLILDAEMTSKDEGLGISHPEWPPEMTLQERKLDWWQYNLHEWPHGRTSEWTVSGMNRQWARLVSWMSGYTPGSCSQSTQEMIALLPWTIASTTSRPIHCLKLPIVVSLPETVGASVSWRITGVE